jgi:glycerol kinase
MAALMESIAFLITINIQEMQKHGIITDQLLVAGGMSKDEHLCQCLANLCSANVIVSDFKEATSRGAAWLAMQQPEWKLLQRKFIYHVKNDLLLNRYEKFRTAIQGLLR